MSAGDDQLSQVSLGKPHPERKVLPRWFEVKGGLAMDFDANGSDARGTTRRTPRQIPGQFSVEWHFDLMVTLVLLETTGIQVQRVPGHLGQHLLCA